MDDVGGMRAPVETTIGPLTPGLLFWIVVALWFAAALYAVDGRALPERILMLGLLMLLGAKVFA